MRGRSRARDGFTLVELLATITIMAVLIVAALPYLSDYTSWARSTSQHRDAQVVASAIARWVALGGDTTGTASGYHDWSTARFNDTWNSSSGSAGVVLDLTAGWTVSPDGPKDPFLSPNISYTVLGRYVKIAFTGLRDYTVTGRTR